MSKDQNKNKKFNVEDVEKLKTCCKMINEIKLGIKYWKFDNVWPINLYIKTLDIISENLEYIIFNITSSETIRS